MTIRSKIPDTGKQLASYKGSELIDRIGEEIVKEVVINVLCGTNIRSLTENLTRKRIALSNSALLMTYLNASNSIEDFQKNMPQLVSKELLTRRITAPEKAYLQWLVGLTSKSIQNVLRGNNENELVEYLDEMECSLFANAEESKKLFGDLSGTICIKGESTNLSWTVLTQIFTAIGAQTLALRGSEKSMYGKLFEKFILGSVLTILGFKFANHANTRSGDMIFWLSERGEKRESDATALIMPGKGVRFDIGFIGPGNTEISLDKVTRFDKERESGAEKHYMSTLIIVDRIGEGSRIVEMAKDIGGNIVQMSMSFWVKEVAGILSETTGFKHEILDMDSNESLCFIKSSMKLVNLKDFI
jgi:hypothetical protein